MYSCLPMTIQWDIQNEIIRLETPTPHQYYVNGKIIKPLHLKLTTQFTTSDSNQFKGLIATNIHTLSHRKPYTHLPGSPSQEINP